MGFMRKLTGAQGQIDAANAQAAQVEAAAKLQQAAAKQAADAQAQAAVDAAAATAQQQQAMIQRDAAQQAASDALQVDMSTPDVSLNAGAQTSGLKTRAKRVQWGGGTSSVRV